MVTPEEIAQAMAVHSVDDSVRSHRDADETGMIMTGTGELRRADAGEADADDAPDKDQRPSE